MKPAIEELIGCAAAITGFSRDAILPRAIERALDDASPEEVVRRARLRDPAVVKMLSQAVSVGETFFFRHPEHFRHLAARFLPGRAGPIKAWSAGCATGEETYSIAACLRDLVSAPVEILGTDLVERNLEAARTASYGSWSRRAAGPLLHPLGVESGGRFRVHQRLRDVTRFERHNLLDAPPAGAPFDLIFCRNVLVYFSPQARLAAVERLVSALAPQGALFFGPMDVDAPPPGLVLAANPEDQIWHRPEPARKEEKPQKRAPRLPTPQALRPVPPEPVALHLRALRHMERNERQLADRTLADLCRLVPDYVPGLVEHALFRMRAGDASAAATMMREVLRRTENVPPDAVLPGPEPLPVRFYRDSADNFLKRAPR